MALVDQLAVALPAGTVAGLLLRIRVERRGGLPRPMVRGVRWAIRHPALWALVGLVPGAWGLAHLAFGEPAGIIAAVVAAPLLCWRVSRNPRRLANLTRLNEGDSPPPTP